MNPAPLLDDDARYRAISSRDARFDGWFFVAVTSTGIFCRPSCPAATPRRDRVRFYPSAAAAHLAGFRACRRCRPDTAPGSPEWNQRADLAGRAMRLVNDGVIDREGVSGLAHRLSVSERHLHRVLVEEVGAGPLALARARRAHTARVLIETTDLPFTQIAFASGFASIRQFNDTVRETFGASPTVLRADRTSSTRRGRNRPDGAADPDAAGGGPVPVSLRLATREPFAGSEVLAFLGARCIPGVEALDPDGTYHRVLRLPHGPATVALTAATDHVVARLRLLDLRDLGPAVERCRRLLDLDADPSSVDAQLGDDEVLAPLIASVPGRRAPGAVDGAELLARAVLGQQVSVTGAGTLASRLAETHGEPLPPAFGLDLPAGLRVAFPSAEALASVDPATIAMPRARGRALAGAMAALAAGALVLEPGADRAEARAALLALPGIGPWTADYVALRALGDPDAFPAGDLGIIRALERLAPGHRPAELAESWRPFRAYAVHHLWSSLAG